ncbi:dihydrolipoamide acetyltransferase family protein [Roseiterribacter gracilis]|uniref:Dihydrolipoamide acetyltransferase component of pyruvate dehydrogenase complex n=1 Tax=Roseiterribacter gracilis TaxID=2812848 RepID=A0A8S8XCZ7_9PROT|nr:lipoamide acyltransferase component of branched-chain alpha-keto acid dehydrogenase complex [Rhodospirillales bacterium TMPK1]
MGRYGFKLPDVGEGTAEAEIAAWHVEIGQTVDEDAPLVDVMTDKATIEITSPVKGKVIARTGSPGDMAPVGSVIVEFEVEGEGNAAGAAQAAAPVAAKVEDPTETPSPVEQAARVIDAPEHTPAAPKAAPKPQAAAPTWSTRTADAKPLASPAVRRQAHEQGVELQYVPGSGPAGRITHGDLDAYVDARRNGGGASSGGSRLTQRHGADEVKVIGLRRKIAERMQDAKRRIPHFMYADEMDVTELDELRAHMNAQNKGRADRPKLTLLPFLMRAMAKVLPAYPQLNARYDDEAGIVHRHHAIHIGIATQTASGLAVPVVRHVEARDIYDCANELARVAQATRDGKATREELSGSTITISSLGPMGGLVSTPVINSPEVGIIAVNKILERPVVKNGQIVVRKMMNLSSSFDHRVVDGWDAAEFIQRVKAVLEFPATLFIDE